MKKIISLILVGAALVALLSGCSGGKKEYANALEKVLGEKKLVVSLSPDFAPMEFVDTGKTGQEQYVGFDVMLSKFVADELGVELVVEPMEFAACQAAVQTKNVDMSVSGYAYLPERAENFELSDYYYPGDNDTEQGILVLAKRKAELNTKESFSGKDVAAQNASLQMNLLTSQLPEAKAVTIIDLSTAVLEVINGKVDALCVAKSNGEAFIANYPELALSDFRFTVEDEGNVVLIAKGEKELLKKVNEILAKAYEKGYYKSWYDEAVAMSKSETAKEVTIEAEEGK